MKRLSSLFALCWLVACSSAPTDITYYIIDEGSSAYQTHTNTAKRHIKLRSVEMPQHLLRNNLATFHGNHTIHYAKQHVWAEPIKVGFTRVLSNAFHQSNVYTLIKRSDPVQQEAELTLDIAIHHFNTTDNGEVLLAGEFWLSKRGQAPVKQGFYLTQALQQDGFAEAVKQHNKLIYQLQNTLEEQITQYSAR